jgi:hypothetical protein
MNNSDGLRLVNFSCSSSFQSQRCNCLSNFILIQDIPRQNNIVGKRNVGNIEHYILKRRFYDLNEMCRRELWDLIEVSHLNGLCCTAHITAVILHYTLLESEILQKETYPKNSTQQEENQKWKWKEIQNGSWIAILRKHHDSSFFLILLKYFDYFDRTMFCWRTSFW